MPVSSRASGNERILLIEDSRQNRYLATFLLEQAGCKVVHAANGPLGIQLAGYDDFDRILLDIQLPGMNGYDVARALRQLPRMWILPIVAVTSYAMPGTAKTLAAGGDGYLEKPINPDTFVADVKRFGVRCAKESPSPHDSRQSRFQRQRHSARRRALRRVRQSVDPAFPTACSRGWVSTPPLCLVLHFQGCAFVLVTSVLLACLVYRDVKGRCRVDEELRRLHEELQHHAVELRERVEARTREVVETTSFERLGGPHLQPYLL